MDGLSQELGPEKILEIGRTYQTAAVLLAAADLNLFEHLRSGPRPAPQVAEAAACDLRGTTTLLDALAAMDLLDKRDGVYSLRPGLERWLTPGSPETVLAMLQHQSSCLRRWAQLASVVKSGRPAPRIPGVRDEAADQEAFIGAMHNISAPLAGQVIRAIRPLQFQNLLDIGGASGTWTVAFLRACPEGTATLFDLPAVIPLARKRVEHEGLGGRVRLVGGDFMSDPLPVGADLAWVSAIIHQNSREENRRLFRSVIDALRPRGRIAIRDILMKPSRTEPVSGALFAINMLVATEGGGTFTFDEISEDLESAGFIDPRVVREDPWMSSIVLADKPS
jgi:predicted O-methyltransferase YrrM